MTSEGHPVPPAAPAAVTAAGVEADKHKSARGDVRVAVLGNVDSGKSTLVGCLTRRVIDNGRGSARALVFRHKHELENGRTSSVATEVCRGSLCVWQPAG